MQYLSDVGTATETVSGRLFPVKSILSLPCAHFPKMRWSGKKVHILSASLSVLVITADVPNHDAPEWCLYQWTYANIWVWGVGIPVNYTLCLRKNWIIPTFRAVCMESFINESPRFGQYAVIHADFELRDTAEENISPATIVRAERWPNQERCSIVNWG